MDQILFLQITIFLGPVPALFFYTLPCFLGIEFSCLVLSTVETFMQLHAECHHLDALLFPVLSEFALVWFFYFLHFCYCSCDFLSVFILTNYYKYEKRLLYVFCVVSLGDILKLWLRTSVPVGSVGDSQPIDTHVPPICPP